MSMKESQEFDCQCVGEAVGLQCTFILLGGKQAFVKPGCT